ncbi:nuclease-related domain-containing protein [Rhodococcus sp. NPDC058639]|uniref:nuclease-related domain-containing protein n=1 Tax=Rhodococcus sp. NPDC058639 TaxID=3346570 RepID=UPI003652D0A1
MLYGNEHRSRDISRLSIDRLMYLFHESGDLPSAYTTSDDFLLSMLTGITYEQFPWQQSMFEELSRSHAWLVEGLSEVETVVLNEDTLAAMLGGVSLGDAIGATFFLQVAAYKNGGTFDPKWLDRPNFAELLSTYPRATISTITDRLTVTRKRYKESYANHATGIDHLARFDYNPLVNTPFIRMDGSGPLVAPAPSLILKTVTPGGLYYAGMAAHGQDFANDLGTLFEHYIGRQLRTIDGADIFPEVVYGKGGGMKSVDWFVVTPDLVLLVEVKSKRLGPAARAGAAMLTHALKDTIHKARRQLARTVGEIFSENLAFSHIPTDRQIVGLVVTAEPFYTAPADLLGRGLATIATPDGFADIPVAVASARDVEYLVTHGEKAARVVLDQVAAKAEGVLSMNVVPSGRNLILENAWKSYPWPRRQSGA